MSAKKFLVKNSRLVLKDNIYSGRVFIEDGIITVIEKEQDGYQKNIDDYQIIDGNNHYLSPGFFEVHFHGQGGFNLENVDNQQDKENIQNLDNFLKKQGVNTYLPTFTYNEIAIEKCVHFFEELNLFQYRIPGIYIEGPFISHEKKGALTESSIKEVNEQSLQDLKKFNNKISNKIKMLTIAPEKEEIEKVFDFCHSEQIIISLGHSNTSLKSALSSIQKISGKSSFINMTHLFNAMSSISHRDSGLATVPFLNENIFFEVITDGVHIQDEILMMIEKNLNKEKMIIVSDSTSSAGCPSGHYQHLGREIVSSEKGVFYKQNESLFVGSKATLSECLNYYIQNTNCAVHEVIAMVTKNPAELFRINDRGSIAVGKKADLILLDQNMKCVENLFDKLN